MQGEALEREAQAIDKLLICPVCPGETIDQAQAELASQMRQVVREKLGQGLTRSQVLDYFSDPRRYGTSVLASPPKSGFNLLVWILPPAGVVGAVALLLLVVRAMRRNEAPLPDDPESLEPYLERVDRELGMSVPLPAPSGDDDIGGGETSSTGRRFRRTFEPPQGEA